ncbi:MAG: alanyl-tRNA editing protein [Acidimicrobiaceae bacterium]|nr:alanyl-tRNA editing protein [Acidimicrobiaceae bacterium]
MNTADTSNPTDRIFLRDARCRSFDAVVVAVDDDGRVALDRTAFYATSGGQPHDTGTLSFKADTGSGDGDVSVPVTDVSGHEVVWHTLEDPGAAPSTGTAVHGRLDWQRRYDLMRTHTALHILCGVVYNTWGVSVTGGNMEPCKARMDFEFGPLPEGFAETVTNLVNAEIAADRPIEVSFLPRAEALGDDALIRTKVNLIPESVQEIRVVDIVGLDKQADGGTHVESTGEVGRFEVLKTESKGKANKRLRIAIHEA